MKILLHTFLCLLLALPLCLYGQKNAEKDSLKTKESPALPLKIKIKYADALFLAGNYYDAIKEYGEILEMKADNSLAIYRLGESYLKVRDYANAEKWYMALIEAGADADFPFVFYRLATAQKMSGKYEEAKYAFAKFALRAQGDDITRAKREIDACDFAKNAMNNPSPFVVTHLDSAINSPFSEYAPAVEGGSLFYASLKKTDAEKNWSRIYSSDKKSAAWGPGKEIISPFNLPEIHTGNIAFSPDGKRAYFTQCTDNGEANILCSIMMSAKAGDSWLSAVPVNIQNQDDKYTYTHPAVAAEGEKDLLYFSSNMPGGSGGFDLWYVEVMPDGSAAAPVNLGSAVNTIDDEITPFYYKNKLYFSSNGHIGLGGFDVFVSSGWKNGWSKPSNLGSPVNSSADDFHFAKGESIKTYYFVSNRTGVYSLKSPNCCDDIFMAQDLGTQKYLMKGKVFEKTDTLMTPLTGARVEVFELANSARQPVRDSLLAGDHEFSIEMSEGKDYEVKVQKKGYFTRIFSALSKDNPEFDNIAEDFVLEKIEKNKAYRLDKVYYEFNKSSLTEESKETIQQLYELLSENPKLVVEISSHTDDIGKDDYNQKLSQNRAQSVVDYLIYLGIESKRLIPKGYGESKPIAPNNTEAGRQENRRTEFKIVGELSRVGDKIIFD